MKFGDTPKLDIDKDCRNLGLVNSILTALVSMLQNQQLYLVEKQILVFLINSAKQNKKLPNTTVCPYRTMANPERGHCCNLYDTRA